MRRRREFCEVVLRFIIKKPSEEISLKQNQSSPNTVQATTRSCSTTQEVEEQEEQSEEESFAIYFLTSQME